MEVAQIISIVSVVLGLILLLTSSLFLDDWREFNANCSKFGFIGEICDVPRYFVIGASFGIVAALIQIVSFALAFLKKWKIWCAIQIAVALAAVIAFSLAIDKNADNGNSKAKAFLAFSFIDFIFSLGAAVGVFFLNRKE